MRGWAGLFAFGLAAVFEVVMKKTKKRTPRGEHYRTLAEGYKILKSPIAASLTAAAEHYDQRDQTHELQNKGQTEEGEKTDLG